MIQSPGFCFGRPDFFSDEEMARRRNLLQVELERIKADVLIAMRQPGYTSPLLLWLGGVRESPTHDIFILKDGMLTHLAGSQITDYYSSPYLQGRKDALSKLLKGSRKIAFLGLGDIDTEFKQYLEQICPKVILEDITLQAERCRAVKSPEELSSVISAVEIHDKVFEILPDFVYPGRRERDIASDILSFMEASGADFTDFDGIIPQTVYIEVHSGNTVNTVGGSISQTEPIRWPGQVLNEDNWFQLCMHGHGLGGYASQEVLKFIIGERDLSTWDGFKADVLSMNLERCIEIQQNALDRYNNR